MAYSFVKANSQNFTTASSPLSDVPITFAAWVNKIDSTAGDHGIIGICKDEADSKTTHFVYTNGPGGVGAFSSDPSGVANVFLSGAGTLGITQHYLGKFSSSNSRAIYLDGVSKATNSTSRFPTGFNKLYIGSYFYNTMESYLKGKISEAAAWSVALTDDEIVSLARGFKPFRVRPQSLVFYAPLVRNVVDIKGALTLTASASSPTVTEHYRIY